MTAFSAFIKRHSVLTYYLLVFVISWGGALSYSVLAYSWALRRCPGQV